MLSGSGQTLTPSSTKALMSEPSRGLLDTSVLIDHDIIDAARLPEESAVSAISLTELVAGPHSTEDKDERARRQDRLQWAASAWDPLPFDSDCARAYGRIFAATRAAGRTSRARFADLLIAATAAANDLPIYTRNPADFDPLKRIVRIVKI